MFVSVNVTAGNNAHFYIQDVTQNLASSWGETFPGGTGSTAEWITEAYKYGNGLSYLANFGSKVFTYCEAYYQGNWKNMGGFNDTEYDLYDNNGLVAFPGVIQSDNRSFTMYRTSNA